MRGQEFRRNFLHITKKKLTMKLISKQDQYWKLSLIVNLITEKFQLKTFHSKLPFKRNYPLLRKLFRIDSVNIRLGREWMRNINYS